MTPGPEAAARRYYDTVDGADAEAVVALFGEEATYRRPGYPPMVGHEALLRFYAAERVIASGRHHVHHVVAHGHSAVAAIGVVAVEGRFSGRLRDGSSVDLGFADFFRFEDGLIVERSTYFATAAV